MAFPPGVATCPVSISAPITFGGAAATVHLEVTPGVRLIWTATGQTLADFIEQPADVSTGTATVTLPTIQPGFQDEAGNAVTSWPYTARVRFEHGGEKRHVPLKAFTIPEGQSSPIDLALIPGGPVAPVLTAPSAVVTSINGATGAVTVEAPSYAQLARDPSQLFVGAVTLTDGAPTSAAIVWPDGVIGAYTGTPSATFPGSIDSYTLTHGTTTYTQPAVTRDASGNITNQPAIVLS
jgi:hypothetical protein